MRLSLLHSSSDAHQDGIWSVAWAEGTDGGAQQLVTGSVDETVQLWTEREAVGDGRVLESRHKFTGHSLGVVSVATAGTLAASSALDSIIRVWDLVTGETKAVLECVPSETWAIAFNPIATDPRLLAVAGGSSSKIKIWSVSDASEQAVLSMPSSVCLNRFPCFLVITATCSLASQGQTSDCPPSFN